MSLLTLIVAIIALAIAISTKRERLATTTIIRENDFILEPLILKVQKLHPGAVIPKFAKPGDAGLDLVAVEKVSDPEGYAIGSTVYRFGLAVEIPEGFVGLMFPRSSIAKYDQTLSNCVGVIDSGYRGELQAILSDKIAMAKQYEVGDRVCQLVIVPYASVEILEAVHLSETVRGTTGFGSSGK